MSTEERLIAAFRRIEALEEHVEMLQTPAWRRAIFWMNGWPFRPVAVPASAQRWRFWHRWRGRRDGRRR